MRKLIILYFCLLKSSYVLHSQPSEYEYVEIGRGKSLDFAFIDKIAKSNKVIFLSENGHFDGTSLDLRYDITKYLIANHGYSKVFMEQSFLEIDQAMRKVKAGATLLTSFQEAPSESRYLTPKYRDFLIAMDSMNRLNRNIGFEGIDVMMGIEYHSLIASLMDVTSKNLDLKQYLKDARNTTKYVYAYLNCLQCPLHIEHISNIRKYSNLAINYFDSLYKISHDDDILKYKRSWEILLESAEWGRTKPYPPIYEKFDPMYYASIYSRGRDSIMAKNVLWNIDNLYKNEKIVVWVSSYHAMKNIEYSENIYKCCVFPGVRPMGSILYNTKLRDSMYTIAFISGGGSWGKEGVDKQIIKKPRKGSPEYFMRRRNLKFAFVNFRTQASKFFYMNPTFENYVKEEWSRLYDGVIYIGNMSTVDLRH